MGGGGGGCLLHHESSSLLVMVLVVVCSSCTVKKATINFVHPDMVVAAGYNKEGLEYSYPLML
jgi:hypothetical protein